MKEVWTPNTCWQTSKICQ